MLSNVLALLKSKALVTILAAVMIAGGMTAAFAATPSGQTLLHTMPGQASPTTSSGHHPTPGNAEGTPGAQKRDDGHPGLAKAQHLASEFHLSTTNTDSAVQAICALHLNAFKGTTPPGKAASSSRVYGYGEIEQLLMLARSLATHNAGANVRGLLAEALQTYASSHSLPDCLKDNSSGPHPDNGNGNGNEKLTTTPTPKEHISW